MTKYLIDTNVILRFINPKDVQHNLATNAISYLLTKRNECFLTSQVLIELWVVATRPVEVNGLGWNIDQTRTIVEQLLIRFPLLEESPEIFPNWLDIVTVNRVMGKRTHDMRLVAAMLVHEVTHILTFNPSDFAGTPGITIVLPQELVIPNNE